MKLPNTKRGWPAGEPTKDWTAEQLLAFLRNQHKQLTAPGGKIRKAVGATDADIKEIADDIARLEKQVAQERDRDALMKIIEDGRAKRMNDHADKN